MNTHLLVPINLVKLVCLDLLIVSPQFVSVEFLVVKVAVVLVSITMFATEDVAAATFNAKETHFPAACPALLFIRLNRAIGN